MAPPKSSPNISTIMTGKNHPMMTVAGRSRQCVRSLRVMIQASAVAQPNRAKGDRVCVTWAEECSVEFMSRPPMGNGFVRDQSDAGRLHRGLVGEAQGLLARSLLPRGLWRR